MRGVVTRELRRSEPAVGAKPKALEHETKRAEYTAKRTVAMVGYVVCARELKRGRAELEDSAIWSL